jgi:uncharacterized protein
MPLAISETCVPLYLQMLSALSGVLDKAAAHAEARKIDPAVLLSMRLYPDMLPFTRQVQIAADFARKPLGRLVGAELAVIADEEKTFGELKARIAKTIDAVKSFKASDIDAGAGKPITFPVGPKQVTMQGLDYLYNFALPNFFFHYVTAYDILRHAGVEIGKFDFMGKIPGFNPV